MLGLDLRALGSGLNQGFEFQYRGGCNCNRVLEYGWKYTCWAAQEWYVIIGL